MNSLTMNNEKILFEKFEIIDTLKKDAQSGVYLANHIFLNKKIILKTLNTELLKDQVILHRFKREAKILARLDHPNIIKVLDFGTYKNHFYLSFEYFEAQSLREFLKIKLPEKNDFQKIISQILYGLSYAHSQKIIHRDLKPENILVDKNLNVKIADFGLALSENETQVTQQESIVGTPGYMSPEQIRGEDLDQRTDIFSFGIIAFELLTGVNPFVGKDIATTINNILFLEKEKLVEILQNQNEDLSRIILRCLEKKRQDRYQSADEILKELGLENKSIENYQNHPKKFEFTKKISFVIAVVFIAALIATLFFHSEKNILIEPQVATQELNSPIIENQSKNTPSEQKNLNEKILPEERNDLNISVNKSSNEETKTNYSNESENGKLMVTCYPWAELYIDDRLTETLPLNNPIELKSGQHKIKLVHPNFPAVEKIIDIQPNSTFNFDFNFYKSFGFVQFRIIPWAEISVNNQKIGITPIEKPVTVNSGKNIIKISNPKYGTYFDTIFVTGGETLYYKLNLNSITYWHNN